MAGSTKTVADRQTGIQVQTSAYGLAVPAVFGTNRIPANLVWFGNFQAIAKTTKTGGKGGGSSSTDYTYTAAVILSLAEGPIAGIGAVWRDKDKTTLSALGLTLFTGTPTQTVWSWLSGWSTSGNFATDSGYGYAGMGASYISQAINYSSTAYLAASSYDLGSAASVLNHSFEVQGLNIIGSGNPDANPAAVVPAILTNQQFGVGFASAQVDALSSYSTYCQAAGLFVSPAYTDQRPAADCIQELADATNAAPLWSGGTLKMIPYGDTAITGNGATYTPNLTPLFDLTDDDFYDNGGPPIVITRNSPADAYNRVQVQFRNRLNQYNQEIVSAEDQDAIEKYGLKVASVITMDFVCVSSIAKQMAQLALQRLLYKRNTYEFELNARFPMLEPMDIVTLTDAGLGMSRTPVRIIQIEEQDHSFLVTAEDLPIGMAHAATYSHDDGLRWQNVTSNPCSSVQAPVIFEMPADPSATGLSVGIAVGGQTTDQMYGGCRVWLSLDGVNYKAEGIIYGSSRYGTLSGALAAASGVDTTNTMHLALRANGQMLGGSTADMTKGTTLIVCGGEYLAYQNATLTGVNAYNLTTLNRGLYGTTGAAHASGDPWVRVDDKILVMPDMDLSMIGQTVHIKLTAFNVYGHAEQDLSSVTDYTYTITGNMKALETPVDFATGVGGAGKPEAYSTVGQNLIYNGNAEKGDTSGWVFDTAVWTGVTTLAATTASASNGKYGFSITKGATTDGGGYTGRAIPVVPGRKYLVRINLSGAVAATSGLYLVMNEKTSWPSNGNTIFSNEITSRTDLISNGPWPASPTSYQFVYTVPAGIMFVSPLVFNWNNGPVSGRFDDFAMTEVVDWSLGITGTGKPEDGSDVTSSIEGAAEVVVQADSGGVPVSGVLPKTVGYKFWRNGVDVSASTTWSVSITSGTMTASISSAGLLSIDASSGTLTSGKVEITGAYNGTTRKLVVLVTKSVASASSGASTLNASVSCFGSTNSTTQSGITNGILVVNTGASGQVVLTASVTTNVASAVATGTYPVYLQFQRWNGSAWVAIGTEVLNDTAASRDNVGETYPGSSSFTYTATGLGANQTGLQFRLAARRSTGTVSVSIGGQLTAAGS
jgi:hypothetical protein